MRVLGRTVNLEQIAFITAMTFEPGQTGHFSIYFSGGAMVRLEWPAQLNAQAVSDYNALVAAISARDSIVSAHGTHVEVPHRPRLNS